MANGHLSTYLLWIGSAQVIFTLLFLVFGIDAAGDGWFFGLLISGSLFWMLGIFWSVYEKYKYKSLESQQPRSGFLRILLYVPIIIVLLYSILALIGPP